MPFMPGAEPDGARPLRDRPAETRGAPTNAFVWIRSTRTSGCESHSYHFIQQHEKQPQSRYLTTSRSSKRWIMNGRLIRRRNVSRCFWGYFGIYSLPSYSDPVCSACAGDDVRAEKYGCRGEKQASRWDVTVPEEVFVESLFVCTLATLLLSFTHIWG